MVLHFALNESFNNIQRKTLLPKTDLRMWLAGKDTKQSITYIQSYKHTHLIRERNQSSTSEGYDKGSGWVLDFYDYHPKWKYW